MKKVENGKMKKLVLHRETLLKLQEDRLNEVAGNATFTASNPCCPPTRTPGCTR
ncbi:MAG TPA: class I lanthipeptide [Thermoanaerobaculia bacterium]|jgi:hypothetical protein|nr:class I lanthipeptide [Thermoanaerobaculia bacterium]